MLAGSFRAAKSCLGRSNPETGIKDGWLIEEIYLSTS